MKEVFILICGVIVFAALVMTIVFAAAFWWESVLCRGKWSDFDNDWSMASGCRVEYNDIWYPEEVMIKVIEP